MIPHNLKFMFWTYSASRPGLLTGFSQFLINTCNNSPNANKGSCTGWYRCYRAVVLTSEVLRGNPRQVWTRKVRTVARVGTLMVRLLFIFWTTIIFCISLLSRFLKPVREKEKNSTSCRHPTTHPWIPVIDADHCRLGTPTRAAGDALTQSSRVTVWPVFPASNGSTLKEKTFISHPLTGARMEIMSVIHFVSQWS